MSHRLFFQHMHMSSHTHTHTHTHTLVRGGDGNREGSGVWLTSPERPDGSPSAPTTLPSNILSIVDAVWVPSFNGAIGLDASSRLSKRVDRVLYCSCPERLYHFRVGCCSCIWLIPRLLRRGAHRRFVNSAIQAEREERGF